MAVDGVEPPFVTTDHRQVVGLCRHSTSGLTWSAMQRLAAIYSQVASNINLLTCRVRTLDPIAT